MLLILSVFASDELLGSMTVLEFKWNLGGVIWTHWETDKEMLMSALRLVWWPSVWELVVSVLILDYGIYASNEWWFTLWLFMLVCLTFVGYFEI